MAFGVIKHNRKRAHRAAWREVGGAAGAYRRFKGAVKFEVHRTKSGRDTYSARACMLSGAQEVRLTARFPKRMSESRGRCGLGGGSTPTLAVKRALSKLAKSLR